MKLSSLQMRVSEYTPNKTFYGRNLRLFIISYSVCPWQAPALPAKTRLGWKGLQGTTTQAYYGNPYITAVISLSSLV
jgi:hypothetical protein